MRTPVCDLLGIDVPVAQAPMRGVSGPELAAAVSNAGGLGTVSVWREEVDAAVAIVRRTRELTAPAVRREPP